MTPAAALALSIMLQGAAAGPFGVWRTHVDDGLVRIEPCGSALCGHVAGSSTLRARPDQTDARNPDPTQRTRPIMGLLMLKVPPVAPGRWGDGWVYDPRNGGTFKAKIQMTPDGRLRLTGCVAPLLCQTQTWTRAE